MKNENLPAIIAALVIILGVQAYMMYRLNDRLNQLSNSSSQEDDIQLKIHNLPKLNPPKWDMDDDLFKGRSWNPYEEIQHMQKEMEHMFDDSYSRFHIKTPLGSLSKTADVDLQEKPDSYIVTANAPGADESSIDVKLQDHILSISIKTEHAKDETNDKNGTYQYRERFVGQFHRVLSLPGPANAAKMKTEYHNGVLKITIPKAYFHAIVPSNRYR